MYVFSCDYVCEVYDILIFLIIAFKVSMLCLVCLNVKRPTSLDVRKIAFGHPCEFGYVLTFLWPV